MGESKQNQDSRRTTKNSRKVATFDEQNQILKQVLEASKKADQTPGEEVPPKETGEKSVVPGGSEKKDDDQQVGREKEKAKRRAETHSGGPPAKKNKRDEKDETTQVEGDSRREQNKLLLEYPDYENFPLSQNGEDQIENVREDVTARNAGSKTTSDDVAEHEVPETAQRREHELSWEEEDVINGEDQDLSDYENEDFEGARDWDGRSISSSMIFPSAKRDKSGQVGARKVSGRSEASASARASSRPPLPLQNNGDNRGLPQEEQNSDLLKHNKPGDPLSIIKVVKYREDTRLCPVRCLKAYIRKTKELRKDINELLISTVKPYRAIGRNTVSNWVKRMLDLAGIDTGKFKAHSTRSAATSMVTRKGIDVNALLKVASWKSEATFGRFYNKPLENENEIMINTLLKD